MSESTTRGKETLSHSQLTKPAGTIYGKTISIDGIFPNMFIDKNVIPYPYESIILNLIEWHFSVNLKITCSNLF